MTRLDNEPSAWVSRKFNIEWADCLDDVIVRCMETTVFLSETGLGDAIPQLLDFRG